MQNTMGNVSKACQIVGVTRKTFYEYRNTDPVFAAQCEDIDEDNLDFAEDKLRQLINGVTVAVQGEDGEAVYTQAPNVTATIFFLKTKGKKRGYVEKTEQEITVNKIEVEFIDG